MLGNKSITYMNWKKEWERYKTIPYNLDIINLGSSMAVNDFDYSLWDKKGANLASAPQDMYYDLQVLEQYGNHLKSGGIVIICMAEFALLTDKYETDDHNYKYYGYLDAERISNYTEKKAHLINTYPALLDNRYLKEEIRGAIKKILRWRNKTKVDIRKNSEKMMAGWRHEFGWDNEYILTEEHYRTISNSRKILEQILTYCIDNNYKSVVVVPPFVSHLKECMPENILQECLWKHLDQLRKKGIQIIDFWNDEDLQGEECYNNSIFLNERGKKILNLKLQLILYG